MHNRLEQIDQALAREVAQIMAREVELPRGAVASIVRVKTSRDFKFSCLWVDVLPIEEREHVVHILNARRNKIKEALGSRLSTYCVPKILFKVDSTSDKYDEVDEILRELKKRDEL